MRVLILSINYWPEVTGIGALTTYRAEYLAAAGHDVEVCTTFPYYPEWKVRPGYGRFLASQTYQGVKVHRTYSFVPQRVTSIKRILFEASFIVSSVVRALFCKRPDVLLVVSPPLGFAASAIFLSRLWQIPYVFDVEDLQPDSAADLGMLPPQVLRFMYKVEAAAYRHAALVSTLTSGMRDRILMKGIPPEKVVLFEPRMDETLMSTDPGDGMQFRKSHGLEGKFVVSHSGNMGIKQGLDVIVDAAALSRHDDSIVFFIVGSGAVSERIQARVKELGLTNVRFMPLLPDDEFRRFLAATDICLVTQQKSVSDIFFPSKLVTYLGAGRPVIASVDESSQAARVIVESGSGRVVTPEDPAALLLAIEQMRNEDLAALGAKAREFAGRQWSTAQVLGYLDRTLKAVASRRMDLTIETREKR